MSDAGPAQSMSEPAVLLAIAGAVATVTLNRPQSRNGLVRGMGGEVCRILQGIAVDPEIRVVVFRGAGADFCPGADLKHVSPTSDGPPIPDFAAYEVTVLLHEMPQVTIAAIRGGCAGAGFGWACACDLRVADDSARLNTAFLDVGVAGDMGVPWTLPRLIGAGRARDLMLLPRKLTAAEAFDIGLVQQVWPAEAFEATLVDLTERLAAAAPMALAGMKSHFVAAESCDLRTFARLEAERHVRLLQSADHAEALRAWTERRPGKFTGR